jgi:hypothetical protein
MLKDQADKNQLKKYPYKWLESSRINLSNLRLGS